MRDYLTALYPFDKGKGLLSREHHGAFAAAVSEVIQRRVLRVVFLSRLQSLFDHLFGGESRIVRQNVVRQDVVRRVIASVHRQIASGN